MNKLLKLLIFSVYLFLNVACNLTSKEPITPGASDTNKPEYSEPSTDLNHLAIHAQITSPANAAIIEDPEITVKAEINNSDIKIEKAILVVDGIDVASDEDGAPWSFSWPAYYWGDGQPHSLKLKLITALGNTVVAFEQLAVRVDESVNKSLVGFLQYDRSLYQNIGELSLKLSNSENSDRFSFKITTPTGEETIIQDEPELLLENLQVGEYGVQYALQKRIDDIWLEGPKSKPIYLHILAPNIPEIFPSKITKNNNKYDLTLSWEDFGPGNSYHVSVYPQSDESKEILSASTEENQLEFKNISPGYYFWTLSRENKYKHRSRLSSFQIIEPGVEKKSLGGDGIQGVAIPIECSTGSSTVGKNIAFSNAVNGEWDVYRNCLVGRRFAGDALVRSDKFIQNFLYQADITIKEGDAAALAFRANNSASEVFYATLDIRKPEVLVWRRGASPAVVKYVKVPGLERNKKYRFAVNVVSNRIKVLLDGETKIDLEVQDNTLAEAGWLGANVYKSTSLFENVRFFEYIAGEWELSGKEATTKKNEDYSLMSTNYIADNLSLTADVNTENPEGIVGFVVGSKRDNDGTLENGVKIYIDLENGELCADGPFQNQLCTTATEKISHAFVEIKIDVSDKNFLVSLDDEILLQFFSENYSEGLLELFSENRDSIYKNIEIDGDMIRF